MIRKEVHINQGTSPQSRVQPSVFDEKADSEIWNMFRQGHEGAFNHIYTKYFDPLSYYGFLFTTDKELVKDCIQDLFIDLRKSGDHLSSTDNIKYYLFKSFRWKISRMLKKRRLLTFTSEMSSFFQLDFTPSHESLLIKNQLDDEVKKKLTAALNELPRRQKEAIYHFYFEDFSYSELARIMGLKSAKSARNLIYKSILKLKQSQVLGDL